MIDATKLPAAPSSTEQVKAVAGQTEKVEYARAPAGPGYQPPQHRSSR
nr:hypothetical protein [uncultured Massilia sp.]